jgi:hypothetical protein
VLRLTSLLGVEVRCGGLLLGRLRDLGALDRGRRPRISSAWARHRRGISTGLDLTAGFEITDDGLELPAEAGEVSAEGAGLLLARHVLDAQLVDLKEKRLVRVGDVILDDGGGLRLAGVEIGPGPVLRRLGLGRLGAREHSETIAWSDLHFTSARADTLQLTVPRASIRHISEEEAGVRPGRRFGRVMRARRHAPQ